MKAYLYSLSSKLIPFILRMNALKSADGTIPVPRCSIVRDLDSTIYRTCNVIRLLPGNTDISASMCIQIINSATRA